jgi:hypothetical protein
MTARAERGPAAASGDRRTRRKQFTTVPRIGHIELDATDRESLVDYFVSAFGFAGVGRARNPSGTAASRFQEPIADRGAGQLGASLKRNQGPGVHHPAFPVDQVVPAVRDFRARGVVVTAPNVAPPSTTASDSAPARAARPVAVGAKNRLDHLSPNTTGAESRSAPEGVWNRPTRRLPPHRHGAVRRWQRRPVRQVRGRVSCSAATTPGARYPGDWHRLDWSGGTARVTAWSRF